MNPLFDERRRPINLGGHSSSTSQVSILNEAKAKREARQDHKRRLQNTVRIQAWWRGMRQARAVRQELRKTFEQDVTGIMGMRCLALIGQDEQALGMWSMAMISSGEGQARSCFIHVCGTDNYILTFRIIAGSSNWSKPCELVRSHQATLCPPSPIGRS